jgi:hypothetical protein
MEVISLSLLFSIPPPPTESAEDRRRSRDIRVRSGDRLHFEKSAKLSKSSQMTVLPGKALSFVDDSMDTDI